MSVGIEQRSDALSVIARAIDADLHTPKSTTIENDDLINDDCIICTQPKREFKLVLPSQQDDAHEGTPLTSEAEERLQE